MATTTPETFTGTPVLTEEKVAVIADWYARSLGDSDKADEVHAEAFYAGQADAFHAVLALLHADTVGEFVRRYLAG